MIKGVGGGIFFLSFYYLKENFMKVDMHIHTIESDGTYTPEEIIVRAIKNNVIAFSNNRP